MTNKPDLVIETESAVYNRWLNTNFKDEKERKRLKYAAKRKKRYINLHFAMNALVTEKTLIIE